MLPTVVAARAEEKTATIHAVLPRRSAFVRKAAQIAKAGIYDVRVHRDEVLLPIIRHWRIFDLSNLTEAAEEARRRLAEHLDKLEAAARRFEERLAGSTIPRIASIG